MGVGDTYLSAWPAFSVFSALILVRAAAASSRAQLTDDVRRRSTSGSAKALPSAVDSLPMPARTPRGAEVHRARQTTGEHTIPDEEASRVQPIQSRLVTADKTGQRNKHRKCTQALILIQSDSCSLLLIHIYNQDSKHEENNVGRTTEAASRLKITDLRVKTRINSMRMYIYIYIYIQGRRLC